MRRAVAAVFGTMLGTGLMIGAKLGTRPASLDAQDATQDIAPVPTASAPVTTPAPGTPTGSPSARPSASSPPPGGGGGGGGLKNGTFAGTPTRERYGTIAVNIVVSGGRITDVSATYPTGGETGSINAKAIPKLRQEALTAQSASIATVSGATYTSGAYKTSLQAAISAAKG